MRVFIIYITLLLRSAYFPDRLTNNKQVECGHTNESQFFAFFLRWPTVFDYFKTLFLVYCFAIPKMWNCKICIFDFL